MSIKITSLCTTVRCLNTCSTNNFKILKNKLLEKKQRLETTMMLVNHFFAPIAQQKYIGLLQILYTSYYMLFVIVYRLLIIMSLFFFFYERRTFFKFEPNFKVIKIKQKYMRVILSTEKISDFTWVYLDFFFYILTEILKVQELL